MTERENSTTRITQRLIDVVQLTGGSRWDRILLLALIGIGILFGGAQVLVGDVTLALVSWFWVVMLVLLASLKRLQQIVLGRLLERAHMVYIGVLWAYTLLWVWAYRLLQSLPSTGKDSQFFYIILILFLAITFRVVLSLFALTPRGYAIFVSRIPVWEKVLLAINEFIASGLLALVLGGELARFLQPQVFTIYSDPVYTGMLIGMAALYYLFIHMMWVQVWNDWLSKNRVWVSLARLLTPVALIAATLVIARHFTRLSDARSADLLGTANLDQAVLALSPVIWMMIFFIGVLVWGGQRGLRQRLLPDILLDNLPPRLRRFLSTISDMDIMLLVGVLATSIPLQLFLFDDEAQGVIDVLRQQIAQQNAIIDSSEQALALLFALPFYLLALVLMGLYAWMLARPALSADDREHLVQQLPLGAMIIFIITLYLCAIPFSQVLVEGRLPRLPQELGRVLAFDVLIPLVLLYAHYWLLVRIPYGRGQSRWRTRTSAELEGQLRHIDNQLGDIERRLTRSQNVWNNRFNLRANQDERIDILYQFIELNGERDRLNMERLRVVDARQQLTEVSEAPIAIAVARVPARVVSLGIPLLIVFKIYEWAVVNDGLREIANNPNIGLVEFFQIILEQTQF